MFKTITSILTTLLFLSYLTAVSAQPVVTSAWHFEWDNPNAVDVIDGTRIYLAQTAGIVPDSVSFVDTVLGETLRWPINAEAGRWYGVVTLYAGTTETAPSNEVVFDVMGKPTNLRIVPPIGE